MTGRSLGRKCAVCGCIPTLQSGITLHRFPTPGRLCTDKARKWAEFAYPNDDWSDEAALIILAKKSRRICSQHFRPQDFIDPGRLIPLAFPCHKPGDVLSSVVTDSENIIRLPLAPILDQNCNSDLVDRNDSKVSSTDHVLHDNFSVCNISDFFSHIPRASTPVAFQPACPPASPCITYPTVFALPPLSSLPLVCPLNCLFQYIPLPRYQLLGVLSLQVHLLYVPLPHLLNTPPSLSPPSPPIASASNIAAPSTALLAATSLPAVNLPSEQHALVSAATPPPASECTPSQPSLPDSAIHVIQPADDQNPLPSLCNPSAALTPLASSTPSSHVQRVTFSVRTPPVSLRTPLRKGSVVFSVSSSSNRRLDLQHSLRTPARARSPPSSAAAAPKTAKRCLLSEINATRFEQLTPRKKTLYSTVKQQKKELARLRQKCAKFKGRRLLRKINESLLFNSVAKKMSPAAAILLQSQLRLTNQKPKGRRWSLDEKILALTIFKKSPCTYRLLRKMFTLPSKSTLNAVLSRLPLTPGISDEVVSVLGKSVKTMKKGDELCVVIFDEMSLRNHVAYNSKEDCMDGFVDHGDQGRANVLASQALVFMVRGIRRKWKQPIAYYLSGNATSSDRLQVLLKDVLRKLFSVGLEVVATVCDLGRNNEAAIKRLKEHPKLSYFTLDGHQIATVFDAPHLLKCTRNMFMIHDVKCTINAEINGQENVQGVAKWADIEQMYGAERNKVLCRHSNLLTDAHLNPQRKQKMKVKLAAQVLSNTVGATLLTYAGKNKIPNAVATASFVMEVDNLFDSLNGSTQYPDKGKHLRIRMSRRSPHMDYWKQEKRNIQQWKFANSNPPSQQGWVTTINAVEHVWKRVQQEGFKFLQPRSLNQDPLENMFGLIRSLCGSNAKPNVQQFVGALKTAIINGVAYHDVERMNCEDDEGDFLCNLRSLLTPPSRESNDVDMEAVGQTDTGTENPTSDKALEKLFKDIQKKASSMLGEVRGEISSGSLNALPIVYISGSIAKRAINQKDCDACKVCLTSDPNDAQNLFITFKEFENPFEESSSLKLVYPSENLAVTVSQGATATLNFLKERGYLHKVKASILSLLIESLDFSWLNACCDHFHHNKDVIVRSIFHIWSGWWSTLTNRALLQPAVKEIGPSSEQAATQSEDEDEPNAEGE